MLPNSFHVTARDVSYLSAIIGIKAKAKSEMLSGIIGENLSKVSLISYNSYA